jgi:polyisoprenoid-binding protein YceI
LKSESGHSWIPCLIKTYFDWKQITVPYGRSARATVRGAPENDHGAIQCTLADFHAAKPLQAHPTVYCFQQIQGEGFAAAMLLVFGAGMAQAQGPSQTRDWKIDPAHSEADFSIKHMAISTVHGSFRGVAGVITFDPKDVAKSAVVADIDVNTVDTGVAARDNHLKSADFFDVAKFPMMHFASTSVAKSGDGYKVTGQLTLHGVTKTVVLNLDTPGKEEPGMDGKSIHRGFTATTTISRKDFGLTWGGNLSSGDAVLGDDVRIELDIEAVLNHPSEPR